MATSVVSSLKQQYEEYDIIVISGWVGVWLNNPNVYRVYSHGSIPYFYDDYINGNDVLIFKHEPYHHQDYILKRKHVIDVWCSQCGVSYDGSAPAIYYNWREEAYVKNLVGSEPYVVIQSSGGTKNPTKYSWVRDIPHTQAQSIVDYLKVKGHRIIQLREKDALPLKNVEYFETDRIRDLFGIIKFSSKRILIDSYSQHVAKAFGLKSIVFWPVDNISTLGYESNENIVSDCDKVVVHKMNSYLIEDQITGVLNECPFATPEVFNLEEVYKVL